MVSCSEHGFNSGKMFSRVGQLCDSAEKQQIPITFISLCLCHSKADTFKGAFGLEGRKLIKMMPSRATPYADNVLVIRDSASMVAWRRHLYALMPRDLPPVTFQLPELSTEQNQTMSARVKRYEQDCGCTSGSFFMSAAVVASVIIYFRSGHRVTDIGVGQAISLLGIAVFAAFSGKLVGLIWARWRLIWIASRLYHMVVSHASPNRCPGLTSEG